MLDTASETFFTIATAGAGVTGAFKFSGAAVVGAAVYFAPRDQTAVGILAPSPPPSLPPLLPSPSRPPIPAVPSPPLLPPLPPLVPPPENPGLDLVLGTVMGSIGLIALIGGGVVLLRAYRIYRRRRAAFKRYMRTTQPRRQRVLPTGRVVIDPRGLPSTPDEDEERYAQMTRRYQTHRRALCLHPADPHPSRHRHSNAGMWMWTARSVEPSRQDRQGPQTAAAALRRGGPPLPRPATRV